MSQLIRRLVSIIIPCYNAERWVAAAIESALGQTYNNVEVIVIDDGSTDRSLEVIKQFDQKIRWLSISNRGPSAARNVGLKAAQGEWIQFLDADDLLHPDKLRLSLKSYESNPSIEFLWAPHSVVGENFTLTSFSTKVKIAESLCLQIPPSQDVLLAPYTPWAAVFRRGFLERVGDWNESLKGWEDLEYHARIAAQLPIYGRLNVPLYFYRQHRGERVGSSKRTISNIHRDNECLVAARAALEASRIAPAVWKSILWGFYLQLARSFALVGDREKFLGLMREAAELRGSLKFRLKCYVAVVCVKVLGLKISAALIERTLRSQNSAAEPPNLTFAQ
jgi:glycosyltransferase involved in cell wall biosynthesis